MRGIVEPMMFLCMLTASVAQAQVIRGTISSREDNRAIGAATVYLVDSTGARGAGTFTNDSGQFALRAPRSGSYIVRVVRIGYRPTQSAPFALTAGEVVERSFTMQQVAIELPAVVTRGDDRCIIRPEEGLAVARVWQAARAGLDAALVTQEQRLIRTTTVRFERDRRPSGSKIREHRWTRVASGDDPFPSASPDSLAAYGYSRFDGDTTVYYAPDAAVLLSDHFSDRHCFRLENSDDTPPGLIGIAFEPAKRGVRLDIEGVLWLDRATSELHHLEYHYTALGFDNPHEQLGGRIDFEQLANGATVVKHWVIRIPIRVWNPNRQRGEWPLSQQRRGTLVAIREAGGEVTDIRDAEGRSLSRSDSAAITGIVHDTITGVPAAGVSVFLAGTMRVTTTNPDGQYRFDALPSGHYTISFDAPSLDSLGVAAPYAVVDLAPGTTAVVDLVFPSLSTLLAAFCPEHELGGQRGLLVGVVHDAESSKPLVGAEVVLSWQTWAITDGALRVTTDSIRASTDSLGAYRVCGTPIGVSVSAKAHYGRFASGTIDIDIPEYGMALRDLRVSLRHLEGGTPSAAILAGTVTGTNGAPLDAVHLNLRDGGPEAVTDSQGRFRLAGLPAGSQTVQVRRVGFNTLRLPVELRAGQTVTETFALVERPVLIDSVRVTARRAATDPTGFLRRRHAIAGGHFFDRREIDSLATVRLSDVLRMTPAVIVTSGGSVQVRRGTHSSLTGCSIQYYVDGVSYEGALDDFQPSEIEAMEVYPDGTSVPARFGGARGSCGVIVLWTRNALGGSSSSAP